MPYTMCKTTAEAEVHRTYPGKGQACAVWGLSLSVSGELGVDFLASVIVFHAREVSDPFSDELLFPVLSVEPGIPVGFFSVPVPPSALSSFSMPVPSRVFPSLSGRLLMPVTWCYAL